MAASGLGIHHQQEGAFLSDHFFADRVAIEGVNGAPHRGAIEAGRRGPVIGDLNARKHTGVQRRVGAMVLFECGHLAHRRQTPRLARTGGELGGIRQRVLAGQGDGFTHALRIGKALPRAAAVPAQTLCLVQGAAIGIEQQVHGLPSVQKTAALGQARITFAPGQQQGQCKSGQDFEHGCQQNNLDKGSS